MSSTAVQRSAAISTISLFSYGSGDRATEWEQQRITISSTLTRVERASGFMPAAITEGRTSAREWARLCELVAQSGFFLAPGEQELVSGSHAGDVEVTVSFVDGSTSTVAHRAFYTVGSSPFWTLVRVIEGSSLNALPLSEPPEPSR